MRTRSTGSRWTGSRAGSPSPSEPPAGRGRRGFTLIEVIVAVAILALALGALLQIFSTGLKGSRAAAERTTAALHAQSKLAEVGTEVPVEEAGAEGAFEDGYRWRVEVRPYAEVAAAGEESGAAMAVAAYEVTVTVSWGAVGEEQSVSLVTLRPASPSR